MLNSAMKKWMPLLLLVVLFAFSLPSCNAFEWRTDLPAAAAEARAAQRLLLLNFSGSDWCGWCRRLDAEVFSKSAFQDYAASNLVCVIADFPRRKQLEPALQTRNERLLRHFGVEGFPTLLLFSPEGELIGQLGYQPGGPAAMIQAIEQARAQHRLRNPALPPGPQLPLD